MKAYKQVNTKKESNIVWISAVFMSIFVFLIILSPVIAQEDQNEHPEIHIDVNKKFDEKGNLVSIDSTKTWLWDGKRFDSDQFDSLKEQLGFEFKPFINPLHDYQFQIHPYWHWNENDSTAYSYFNDLFNDDAWKRSKQMKLVDSTLITYFREWEKHFDLNLFMNEFNEDFEERLKRYHEENQRLIEKYFGIPDKQNFELESENMKNDIKGSSSVPI